MKNILILKFKIFIILNIIFICRKCFYHHTVENLFVTEWKKYVSSTIIIFCFSQSYKIQNNSIRLFLLSIFIEYLTWKCYINI